MLVITGSPGVGKHTLAKRLAPELGIDILDINEVAISNKVYKKRGTVLEVDTARLGKIIKKMASRNAIVVGHLAPYVLEKRQVSFALVLRKSPYKLVPIYEKRRYTKRKIAENAGSEILGITLHDAAKKFGPSKMAQLDTTGVSVKKMTEKARRILRKKKGDAVDWLELVARNGDLARFFPQ